MTRDPFRRALILAALACVSAQGADAAFAQDKPAPDRSEVVTFALTLLGTPYRYGGSEPSTGFDCSGFVRYVFGKTLDLQLPRRSQDIQRAGIKTSLDAVKPGDLLFFNTLGQPWSHVAIALGDGRFVHAPARGGRVRVERLAEPYWTARFNGARRLDGPAGEPVGAATEPQGAPRPVESVVDNPRVTP